MSAAASDPLAVALDVAVEAGRLLASGLERRGGYATKRTGADLVTEYDQRSEALIVERLRAAFPGDAILAEEGGLVGERAARGGRWLVDPLDGTTNFAHGLPVFCVSIAREDGDGVEVGVVHAPALGWTYAARRGGGATLGGRPIRTSDEADLGRALLATGFPYDLVVSRDDNFAQFVALYRRSHGVRRLGAAALDLCLVAQGAFDGYWEMKLKPWDLAAGALVVAEAGGRVSGWAGEPLALERGAVVATNGPLHDAVLAALAEVGIPAPAAP